MNSNDISRLAQKVRERADRLGAVNDHLDKARHEVAELVEYRDEIVSDLSIARAALLKHIETSPAPTKPEIALTVHGNPSGLTQAEADLIRRSAGA